MKIKHWDEYAQKWVLDGASNASELELTNPNYSENPISIDEGFTKVHNRLSKLDKNLAWIYINGAKGGSGGGGSGGSNITINVSIIGDDTLTVSNQDSVILTYNFTSIWNSDNYPTGKGTAKYEVNGVSVYSQNIPQGEINFNITRYLKSGDNVVTVSVTDSENNTRSVIYNINVINLSISSTFDNRIVYSDSILFRFTPSGNVNKTIHFLIDGEEVGTMNTDVNNKQLSYFIPKQDHGDHILEVYTTAFVNNKTLTSNVLKYSIICIVPGIKTPIIASSFLEGTYNEFETINIDYTVYDPDSLESNVNLFSNNILVTNLIVNRTPQIWNYKFTSSGEVTLVIMCKDVKKEFVFNVIKAETSIEPITDNLSLHLTSFGRSNNEENPSIWKYNNINATLSNFNFINNGWILKNNETVLRINGNASVEIPYKIFNSDFKSSGKTIEFEFSTSDINDYDSVIISCLNENENAGFQIKTQDILFKSQLSSVSAKFKEDEKIRVSIVVEKSANHRFIYIYLNGKISKVTRYPISDDFKQRSPLNIILGNPNCTLDIYNIRIYDNDLNKFEILNNYIADLPTASEKLEIYSRNQIFDDYDNLEYSKLVEQIPCMIITGDLPTFKGDVKLVNIEYKNIQNDLKSFTLRDAQIDIQGTSSVFYPRNNYVFKPTYDFVYTNGNTSRAYVLKDGDLAAKIFCIKADYMESSGTHNTGLAIIGNDLAKEIGYLTPPQIGNPSVRTAVNGLPIVVFHKKDSESDLTFYGKYNFNHDKEAEEIFGFVDPLVQESWEFLNNTSDNVLFKTADFTSLDISGKPIWVSDFSARYPAGNTYFENLRKVCAWVASTKNDLNKFRTEINEHFNLNNLIFYYVFTEVFGMVDQRAKNQFITSWGKEFGSDEYIWYFLIYDNDTANGLNNEGVNVFNYNIEYHDLLGTANVWNGEQSVLWNNLEKVFADEIDSLYTYLRLNNLLSYDKVIKIFNEQQSNKWNESVYNIDTQFKYLDPVINNNNSTFLYAAQGSREDHRKWWLYNRFKYLDSKYNTGDFATDFLTMRIYTPTEWTAVEPNADFYITPYSDQYIQVKYGSYENKARGTQNKVTRIESPNITFNDTETIIYGASRISSLGDLSGKYPGTVDVTKAIKLKELIIGNKTEGYVNTNMHSLSIGNNNLLKKLDVTNCPNLTDALDIQGCENIEEIYAEGTTITSILLPTSGIIKKLYLPSTITNISLKNQLELTNDELKIGDLSKISSIVLENVPKINSFNLLLECLEKSPLQKIRILNLNGEADSLEFLFNLANNYNGIDENGLDVDYPVLTGNFHINGIVEEEELVEIKSIFLNLNITYDGIKPSPRRTVVVKNASTGESVPNSTLLIDGITYVTDSNGAYVFVGKHGISGIAKANDLLSLNESSFNFSTITENTTNDILLYPYAKLTVTIKSSNGAAASGAKLMINNNTYTANSSGVVDNVYLKKGQYKLEIEYTSSNIIEIYEETFVVDVQNISKSVTTSGIMRLKPEENGNIQFLVKPNSSKLVEIVIESGSNLNYIINWGDGVYDTYTTTGTKSHVYSDLEYKNIEISNHSGLTKMNVHSSYLIAFWSIGDSKIICDNNTFNGRSNLYYIGDVFKNNILITSFKDCFRGCKNLTSIHQGLFDANINVTNFNGCFYYCPNLTSIPQGLFDNCSKVTDFGYCFYSCENLTSIPQGLFNNCVNVTNFNSCFITCRNLTSIPEGLFDNCSNVTTFERCFYQCSSLTSIPEGLFDNCSNVTTFERCFYQCWNLTSIPEGLFDNCVNVTNFNNCFWSCSKLTSIPEGLFNDCVNVTNFGYCFYGCSNLTSIPQGLFDNNINVTNFDNCFYGCRNLTSIPQGLFDNCSKVTTFSECFYQCSNLTSIPEGLFDNCSKVTSFNTCFQSCYNLTSIPQGLFDNCVNVTDFSTCFSYCSNLTSIPQGLFDTNINVTDFSYCFYGCTNLTSIPEGLFDNNVNVTNFSWCFRDCSKLTSIPEGLFDNCSNVTDFSWCFRSCSKLTSIPQGLFDNCSKVTTFSYCFDSSGNVNLNNLTLNFIKSAKASNLNNTYAFNSSVSNIKIIVSQLTPISISSNTFRLSTLEGIYVPDESLNLYKTATNWSAFSSIIKPISEYVE